MKKALLIVLLCFPSLLNAQRVEEKPPHKVQNDGWYLKKASVVITAVGALSMVFAAYNHQPNNDAEVFYYMGAGLIPLGIYSCYLSSGLLQENKSPLSLSLSPTSVVMVLQF